MASPSECLSPSSPPSCGRAESPVRDDNITCLASSVDDRVANDIAAIVDRIEANEFPVVLPSQQHSMAANDAIHILTYVQKVDAVKVQSYMTQQYQKFRESATNALDPEDSEQVVHARWARDFYYLHLKAYDAEARPDSVLYDAVASFLDDAAISADVDAELRRQFASVDIDQAKHFSGHQ